MKPLNTLENTSDPLADLTLDEIDARAIEEWFQAPSLDWPAMASAKFYEYTWAHENAEAWVLVRENKLAGLSKLQAMQVMAQAARYVRHLAGQHNQKTHGHGGGGGSVELSAGDAKELHSRLETPDGGFTVNPRTGEDVKSGYAVAIYPQRSFDARVEDVTPNDLQRYVEKNADLLADNKNMFGGWHDPESGRVWLDVSRVESSKEAAIKLAKQHNQIAIFDLGSGNSIDTGGTGQA